MVAHQSHSDNFCPFNAKPDSLQTSRVLLAGFALYLLDATFRIAQRMHVTPADGSSKASGDGTLATLTFRWSHVADLLPSQIMWINIPSISILHWHPVSVAHVQLDDGHDADSTGTVTVHYKAYGPWTKVCSADNSVMSINVDGYEQDHRDLHC